jgi:hypothetical protein
MRSSTDGFGNIAHRHAFFGDCVIPGIRRGFFDRQADAERIKSLIGSTSALEPHVSIAPPRSIADIAA